MCDGGNNFDYDFVLLKNVGVKMVTDFGGVKIMQVMVVQGGSYLRKQLMA